MAKNSKVQGIALKMEIGHHDDRVCVTFNRRYHNRPRFHQMETHSYRLRSSQSGLRLWELANNPEASRADIDVGASGFLSVTFEVDQLQGLVEKDPAGEAT